MDMIDKDLAKHYAGDTPLPGAKELDIGIRQLLNTRHKTHGDYTVHADITQQLKNIMYPHITNAHTNPMRESLDMIAHKIGRILAGDPDFRDHWDDIAGYAKLIADRCTR